MATVQESGSGAQTIGSALIIDDHPLFCEALSMTLSAIDGVGEVRTSGTLEAALEALAAEAPPDVILLDLNLPDVSGLDGLIRLKTAAEETPVIVVSSMSEDRIVAMAIRAGASGFVPKHSQGDVFREALSTVAGGGVYTPRGFDSGEDAQTPGDDVLHRLSSLTLQQARILALVCEGQLNKQIAHELSIAETTVKAHMTAILRKLGVHSRTQAVLIAQQANFSQLLQRDTPTA